MSITQLVSTAVEKCLAEEMGDFNILLNNALAKIKNLEEEIAHFREISNNNFPILKSSKTDICRHWLKHQCTWQQKCRFRHGDGATSTSSPSTSPTSTASSLSGSIAKDTDVVVKTSKVEKSVQVSFPMESTSDCASKCVVPIPSSVLTRPSFVSGVLQPELVGAALTHDIAEGVVDGLLDAVVEIANKTDFAENVAKDAEWVENMLVNIARLEERYSAKYKPVEDDGIIYSAEVPIPRVDFSKVKPHLHRNLPKPTDHPVHSCSQDPKFYAECFRSDSHNIYYACGSTPCKPKFDTTFPFGSLPGFETNLGIVAVPQAPIGGYIYAGGCGTNTTWQLYAEAVYT